MKVTWAHRAIDDLRSIRQHIAKRNPAAAERVASLIKSRVSMLRHQPLMGRAIQARAETRELVLDDYVVVYQVHGDIVVIARIWHGKQRWWG